MALVDYSDSEDDDDNSHDQPQAKKRKLSVSDKQDSTLPPLPPAFRDLYSSTVRTSTQDDPTLHDGRRRVTPHVAGNWPTHVYLEWRPRKEDYDLLCLAVRDIQHAFDKGFEDVHSFLQNDLGVQLPLHVSLSRPLALKTEQKDRFLAQLKTATASCGVQAFTVKPFNLIWHPNEDQTRWFLVLQLQRTEADELPRLLKTCNSLADRFGQPLLYDEASEPTKSRLASDKFHVSIAWSLRPPAANREHDVNGLEQTVSGDLRERLGSMTIAFSEVKVRIGQDVTAVHLQKPRIASNAS